MKTTELRKKVTGTSVFVFLVAAGLLTAVAFVQAAAGQGQASKEKTGHGYGQDKVTLCHVPPGNPSNAHTISVGSPAVQAHLGHGDALGECK